MPAAVYNIPEIEQGASFAVALALKDETGAPLDLTPYVVRGQFRRTHGASTAVDFTCTKDDPETAGVVTLSLSAEQTAGMLPGPWVYDVEIASAGAVYRVLRGTARVSPEVTR